MRSAKNIPLHTAEDFIGNSHLLVPVVILLPQSERVYLLNIASEVQDRVNCNRRLKGTEDLKSKFGDFNRWLKTTKSGQKAVQEAWKLGHLLGSNSGLEFMREEFLKEHPNHRPTSGRPKGFSPNSAHRAVLGHVVARALELSRNRLQKELQNAE